MLKDKLGIDDKDIKLMTLLMKEEDISQSELAEKLRLSQPSINVRVRKLKERGVLAEGVGLDAQKANISMVRVDFTCNDSDRILNILKNCSFFVNGFLMSGTRNVSVFLIGEDLGKIEQIVKRYLRNNAAVSNIEVNVVVNIAKQFICSVDLEKEHSSACSNPHSCDDCNIMIELKGRKK